MKKLFFAICFTLFLGLWQNQALAESREVSSFEEAGRLRMQDQKLAAQAKDSGNEVTFGSPKAFYKYLKSRLQSKFVTKYDPMSADNGTSATSAVEDEIPEPEQKSTFQQIYENALKRIENEDKQRQALQPQNATFSYDEETELSPTNKDVVDIRLPPFDTITRVPAFEHIPYMFTKIEILPDGLAKFTQDITVLANGQKLKSPLVLPVNDVVVDRNGKRKLNDISLLRVTINGTPVDYKISKQGGSTLFIPAQNFPLENGVYRYIFEYSVDRQIVDYSNFDEFYWNVTASSWNLVIARAGASVILPQGVEPLELNMAIGYPNRLNSDNVLVTRNAPNVFGFVSKDPLFLAEGMYILVDLPKGAIDEGIFSGKFSVIISDYGDIIFSAIAFLAVLISFLLSWKYIQKNVQKANVTLKKTPMMYRFLLKGKCDRITVVAFLLDLFKKNIIDIQKNEENVLLVKRTDNLKILTPNEKKGVYELFGKRDAILNVKENLLKLKRVQKYLFQDVKRQFNVFCLKAFSGYLFFSLMMVLLTEIFIANLKIDTFETFNVLLFSSVFFMMFLVGFFYETPYRIINIILKTVSVILMLLTFVIMCAKVSPLAALFLVLSLACILYFARKYTRRDGLIRGNILDAQKHLEYLKKHQDSICLGKDFLNQQANIFALECQSSYPNKSSLKDYYKLDVAQDILKLLS